MPLYLEWKEFCSSNCVWTVIIPFSNGKGTWCSSILASILLCGSAIHYQWYWTVGDYCWFGWFLQPMTISNVQVQDFRVGIQGHRIIPGHCKTGHCTKLNHFVSSIVNIVYGFYPRKFASVSLHFVENHSFQTQDFASVLWCFVENHSFQTQGFASASWSFVENCPESKPPAPFGCLCIKTVPRVWQKEIYEVPSVFFCDSGLSPTMKA